MRPLSAPIDLNAAIALSCTSSSSTTPTDRSAHATLSGGPVGKRRLQGRMKPAGLQRDQIGRETRQSILAAMSPAAAQIANQN
jgi:hypothetical protein